MRNKKSKITGIFKNTKLLWSLVAVVWFVTGVYAFTWPPVGCTPESCTKPLTQDYVNQRVGIANSNPQEALDVAGGVRIGQLPTASIEEITCTGSTLGTMVFDTDEDRVKVCKSTGWEEGVSETPLVEGSYVPDYFGMAVGGGEQNGTDAWFGVYDNNGIWQLTSKVSFASADEDDHLATPLDQTYAVVMGDCATNISLLKRTSASSFSSVQTLDITTADPMAIAGLDSDTFAVKTGNTIRRWDRSEDSISESATNTSITAGSGETGGGLIKVPGDSNKLIVGSLDSSGGLYLENVVFSASSQTIESVSNTASSTGFGTEWMSFTYTGEFASVYAMGYDSTKFYISKINASNDTPSIGTIGSVVVSGWLPYRQSNANVGDVATYVGSDYVIALSGYNVVNLINVSDPGSPVVVDTLSLSNSANMTFAISNITADTVVVMKDDAASSMYYYVISQNGGNLSLEETLVGSLGNDGRHGTITSFGDLP